MLTFNLAIAILLTRVAQGQEIDTEDIVATFNRPSEEIASLQDYADEEYADLVIKFYGSKGLAKANELSKNGAKYIDKKLKTAAVSVKGSDISSLLDDPGIELVEIDYLVYALPFHPEPARSFRGRNLAEEAPWGIDGEFGIDLAGLPPPNEAKWNPIICVVDTGYATLHPDLPSHAEGYNPYTSGRWDVDKNGHGTHCAGTIGAIGGNNRGVTSINPDPSQYSFYIGKGLNDNGSGSNSGVMASISNCVSNGAKIISMSLGGGPPSTIVANQFQSHYEEDGVLFVAAAGNDGNSALSYPASYPHVISVAAHDIDGNKASFSQYNNQVELSGPGVDVKSTTTSNNGKTYTYATWSGTSMATPHVAGVAARVWSYFPNCTNHQIRSALIKAAVDAGVPGCDSMFGFGRVNAERAYDLLASGGCNQFSAMETALGGCNQPTGTPSSTSSPTAHSPSQSPSSSVAPSSDPTFVLSTSSPTPRPTLKCIPKGQSCSGATTPCCSGKCKKKGNTKLCS
ncbi:hypothetical protein ACHAXS_012851 [Conticribra weissflogii]